jgi:hypothetical protein
MIGVVFMVGHAFVCNMGAVGVWGWKMFEGYEERCG